MENVVSMEEVRSKKLVRKEAGQASGGHDQVIEEGEELSIVVHERVRSTPNNSMEQKFKILLDAAEGQSQDSQPVKPHIQRVPFMLRDNQNFKKYYEPRAVSIGPLHHGNPKLKLAEKLKHKLAGLFIKEHIQQKEAVYETIKNDLKNLKECYDEEEIKKYDDEDLAWMFFVDGCAILHYIKCVAEEDHKKLKALKIKNDHIAIAQQDLFLLENQLPFKVLELLIVGSNAHENKLKESIIKFVDGIIKSIRSGLPPNKPQQDKMPQATHLLELLRERLVGNNRQKVNETKYADWHSFRNIHELKAAGIQLERRETDHLTDISFTSGIFTGTLELSSLVVDDSTAPKFLNMIAYEMCPDFNNEFEVTSYISFLDSLIDHPEDVKELRNKGILHNFLGSDEEVAKLFNEIGTDLVPDTDKYSEVKKLIQDHYNKKCNTWIAEFYHNHFSSPWTITAFAAAVLALLLSSLQTWYAMHPATGK